MTKELQGVAWSVLPKEFKEEVKYEYCRVATKASKDEYDLGFMHAHEGIFGIHNLTSDADGAEILCVFRKRVQEMYAANERIKADFPDKETAHISDHINHVLKHLFGSKCLPDNVESSEPNVDSLHDNVDSLPQNPTENCDNKSHISADCNKPAEPKFKPNDKVIFENVVCTIMQVCYEDYTYSLKKDKTGAFFAWIAESDLEPYTEPTDFGKEVNFSTKKQSRNLSQEIENCDNRLQIAAMAMQGILSNENAIQYAINNFRLQDGSRNRYQAVAECSLAFADVLIAEVEKGAER